MFPTGLFVVQTGFRDGRMEDLPVPRRTWLDSKIDMFLQELAASSMHLDRHRAGELITGQVHVVATLMRVTEATARTYLGDEIIKDMARRMLFEVAGLGQITAGAAPEQPGNPAEILFPPALLRRAARYISGAADLAANGGHLPDGIPETARNQLAATLRRDADGLIAITTTD